MLWHEGVRLSRIGECEEAAWKFLVALFMDFSLDANDMVPVQRALEGCSPQSSIKIALQPFADAPSAGTRITLKAYEAAHLAKGEGGNRCDLPTTLESQDRDLFARCCAALFYARMISHAAGAVGQVDDQELFEASQQ